MDERGWDQADAITEALIAEGIGKAHLAVVTHPPDWDHCTCVVCGDDVLPARLALDKHTCVECQRRLEHRQRLHS